MRCGGITDVLVLVGFLNLFLAGCAGQGRVLFIREGCVNCHKFRDLGGGGAPDLTEVASRRDAVWIRRQIKEPNRNNPGTRMPAFENLSWFEVRALDGYLRQ